MVRYNFPEYEIELEISDDVYFPAEDTFFLINSLVIPNSCELVFEVGGGSGIISIVLAKKYPELRFIVGEISYDAAKLISSNCRLNEVSRQIDVICMDSIYSLKDVSPNLIIWNPPYLPAEEDEIFPKLDKLALFGGEKGYEEVYQLINYLKEKNFTTSFFTIFSSLAWDTSKLDDDIGFEILDTTKFFFEKLYLIRFDFSDKNVKRNR